MGGIDYRAHPIGGLAAVIAPELTREALFQAMRDRRTFATSGQRMLIDMRLDGACMGQELRAQSELTISLRAVGTRPLKQVDLIKNGTILHTWSCENIYHAAEVSDPAGLSDSTDYYYARALQEDGHLAWASPCWVTWD